MEIQTQIIDLVRIVTNLHRRACESSPHALATLDQSVMTYRQLMIEAELDPDEISTKEVVNYFKLMVVMLHIADQMRANGDLIVADHLNTTLMVNETTFAIMAAFAPAILEAPAGYWGSDDEDEDDDDYYDEDDDDYEEFESPDVIERYEEDEGDDDETF
jgi:hypothetical protein